MSGELPLWGGKASETWRALLLSPDERDRRFAVDALRHIERPVVTIPLFVEALADASRDVRALAAHALYDMAFDEEHRELLSGRIGEMIPFLRDEYVEVSLNLVHLMEELGPAAGAALPELVILAGSDDERTRIDATDAIASISG